MDATKYVLKYLAHTSSHGINLWFKQGKNRLSCCVSLPEGFSGTKFIILLLTDSNWGPQDASKPHENETQTLSMEEELKSIQGFYISCMGSPLYWGVTREKWGSQSSYIAEIKPMNKGTKGIQFLRNLMKQLGLPDADKPTPILNNNWDSPDWIELGCRPTNKLRHENLLELGIVKVWLYDELSFHWIPGSRRQQHQILLQPPWPYDNAAWTIWYSVYQQ